MTTTTDNIAVLVTGSRSVPEYEWKPYVWRELNDLHDLCERMIVMHGDCSDNRAPFSTGPRMISIDAEVRRWCEYFPNEHAIQMKFPAFWSKGTKAGPDRNLLMVNTLDGLRLSGV